jgi:hypothetical protein
VAYGQKAAAILHQRLGQSRHANERVHGDIHCTGKALAGAIRYTAVKVLLRAESDRVQTAWALRFGQSGRPGDDRKKTASAVARSLPGRSLQTSTPARERSSLRASHHRARSARLMGPRVERGYEVGSIRQHRSGEATHDFLVASELLTAVIYENRHWGTGFQGRMEKLLSAEDADLEAPPMPLNSKFERSPTCG